MPSDAYSSICYAQCWEDADVMLQALNVQPGQVCLSIASAGDNTLALLCGSPERVIAIDTNPAQLACLELRVAAYRELNHPELLELMGSTPSRRRGALYNRCRPRLTPAARRLWDRQWRRLERAGIGGVGRFERYFTLFRRCVLPLVFDRAGLRRQLEPGPRAERERDYQRYWEGRRWRVLSRIFLSQFCLGRLARYPECFRCVDGQVTERLLSRMRHGLTDLDPSLNPYLAWMLTGGHHNALPYSLRPENFEAIRANLNRLEWRCARLESIGSYASPRSIDCFNLSDVFEYMPERDYAAVLDALLRAGRPGARLVYWNLLVPRSRPESMAARLRPLTDLSQRLHEQDRAFFYGAVVVEEVV